ncbi:hypothetical protein [Asanoa siamensis]|nr:hypothetical protein [Asanoa siamensis]
MRACAVLTLVDLLMVGAKYEDRVMVVTHSTPDIPPLGFLAVLVELATPLDTVLAITGSSWILAAATTAVAFLVWRRRTAKTTDLRPWWTALLLTTPLVAAAVVWRQAVVAYEIGGQQMRDTRPYAYLLWATAAAAVLYTTARGRKIAKADPVTRPDDGTAPRHPQP